MVSNKEVRQKMNRISRAFQIFLFTVIPAVPSMSQERDADSLVREADSLRHSYEFVHSVALYRQALEMEEDSLKRIAIEDLKLQVIVI